MVDRSPVFRRRRRAALAALVGLGLLVTIVALRSQDGRAAAPGGRPAARSPSSTRPSPSATTRTLSAPPPIPGYLLIADRGNNRMLLVDGAKHVLWRYPGPGVKPGLPFVFDDDTFFSADHRSIISNQEDQQTIEMISFPQGRLLWHYGHVDVRGSGSGYLSTPDDAYLLPDGTRTVADIRNCRILFISPAGKIVKQYGETGACRHDPPRAFAQPNGDTPLPDGSTLVTEIVGSWVDLIGPTGKLRWSVHAPVAYPSDAQYLGHGRILLADYSAVGHVVIMTTRGKVLWRYGPSSGAGALSFPSLAMRLPNGLVAVNDDHRDRVVLIDPRRNRIVWQYGHTDVPGMAHGFLHTPDGMDFLPFAAATADPVIRAVVSPSR